MGLEHLRQDSRFQDNAGRITNLPALVEEIEAVFRDYTTQEIVTRLDAVSVPCGTSPAGLPVGAQLVGRLRQTRDLLRVAGCCERVWG